MGQTLKGPGVLPRYVSKRNISRWTVRNRATSTPFASPHAFRLPSELRPRFVPSFACIVFCFMGLAVAFGVPGRGYSRADAPPTVTSGTKIYVRLETGVSTKTSHLNQVVTTRVVREVTCDLGVLVPIGAEVTGKIEKLIPASDPTDHARLLIHFTKLAIPRHPPLDLTAHLTDVENARETVLQDGT